MFFNIFSFTKRAIYDVLLFYNKNPFSKISKNEYMYEIFSVISKMYAI